jgi:hypothetical protein
LENKQRDRRCACQETDCLKLIAPTAESIYLQKYSKCW